MMMMMVWRRSLGMILEASCDDLKELVQCSTLTQPGTVGQAGAAELRVFWGIIYYRSEIA